MTGVVGTQWSSKAGRRANYFEKEQRICWQLILGSKGEISFYTPAPTAGIRVKSSECAQSLSLV